MIKVRKMLCIFLHAKTKPVKIETCKSLICCHEASLRTAFENRRFSMFVKLEVSQQQNSTNFACIEIINFDRFSWPSNIICSGPRKLNKQIYWFVAPKS